MDVAIRYGVSDRVDLGLRAGSSFLELQSKFLLTPVGHERIAVSIAPVLGGAVLFGAASSGGVFNFGVPVLVGIKFGDHQLVLGPRFQAWYLFGITSSTGSKESGVLFGAGCSLGFLWKVSENFGLLPDVGLVYPFAYASTVGSGSTANTGVDHVLLQFKMGILIDW